MSGTILKNRNLQAEWMPRVDLEAIKSASVVEGTALVKIGSLLTAFRTATLCSSSST